MPAAPPAISDVVAEQLTALGAQIRARRKGLSVNGTAAAKSAGISRVTLHRIERGTPAVTIGAYLNVATALGLCLELASSEATDQALDRKG